MARANFPFRWEVWVCSALASACPLLPWPCFPLPVSAQGFGIGSVLGQWCECERRERGWGEGKNGCYLVKTTTDRKQDECVAQRKLYSRQILYLGGGGGAGLTYPCQLRSLSVIFAPQGLRLFPLSLRTAGRQAGRSSLVLTSLASTALKRCH